MLFQPKISQSDLPVTVTAVCPSGSVVLPGGIGTLDELFEALTLVQTQKVTSFPIVLIGTDYWSGLLGWLRDTVRFAWKSKILLRLELEFEATLREAAELEAA